MINKRDGLSGEGSIGIDRGSRLCSETNSHSKSNSRRDLRDKFKRLTGGEK